MEKIAKALGEDDTIENVKLDWFTKDMIENFSQARKSYAEGLASLYLTRDKFLK